jgi:hypothetical protein
MVVFGNRRLGPGFELLLSPEVARAILAATVEAARVKATARWERVNLDVDDLAWTPDHFEGQRRFLLDAIEVAAELSIHAPALRRWGRMVASHPRDSVQVGRRWQWVREHVTARHN